MNTNNIFSGFSKLTREQRLSKLKALGFLSYKDIELLKSHQKMSMNLAESFIENALGYFELPFGVAVNFKINNRDYVIPMAIEETSVIAACSKTAKWIKEHGNITTRTLSNLAIGQIQFNHVKDYQQWKDAIIEHKQQLIEEVNATVALRIYQRGGGLKEITFRKINRPDGGVMGVVHLLINTCDAMGANTINQICEYLKYPLELITQEKALLYILSNLNDTKLTQSKIIIHNIDKNLGRDIEEASLFAELDPYRATTNNKGIINGIDGVLIATGNDWRAVDAAIHAYAARKGKYQSLSQWTLKGNDLVGSMRIPMNVGIVGGMTRLHPLAHVALDMLQVHSSNELGQIITAVGLVQNLGALRALVSQGICQGHMKLHLQNICVSVNAAEHEKSQLLKELTCYLESNHYVSQSTASEILKKIRKKVKSNIDLKWER